MDLSFSKYHGAGNDFIVFDMTSRQIKLTSGQLTRMCDRKRGIGADGVLVLGNSDMESVSYKLDYYNADGHEGSLCGNGSRCSVAVALEKGLQNQVTNSGCVWFETCDGVHCGGMFGNAIQLGNVVQSKRKAQSGNTGMHFTLLIILRKKKKTYAHRKEPSFFRSKR